ncbi:nose resistant to fluoxetine protein 6-like [Ornithodoros turicata]|uniref:nose resistant to fluoxetine protein 6-like n=1 Tax=Ornithodoros turicata TaxID=34597 RepID=UPI003138892D
MTESCYYFQLRFCVCLLLALILAATAFDLKSDITAQKASEQGGVRLWIGAFSLTRNLRTLTVPEDPDVAAAQGVKAISMAWLIFGHTYFLAENTHMFSGLLRAYDNMAGDLFFSPFINYTLAVTTFFLISGLFIAYRNPPSTDALTVKACWRFVVQRYFRMTAPFLAVLSLLLLLPLMTNGPFWEDYAGAEIRRCSSVWWTNLFFISNFWTADQMVFPV